MLISPRNQYLVLIVGKERLNRLQLRFFVKEEGYQTAEAKNGREALTIFSTHYFSPSLNANSNENGRQPGLAAAHSLASAIRVLLPESR